MHRNSEKRFELKIGKIFELKIVNYSKRESFDSKSETERERFCTKKGA